MLRLNLFIIICLTGVSVAHSQELTLRSNAPANLNLSNYNEHLFIRNEICNQKDEEANKFRNRIIPGVGFTPSSEDNIDISLQYLKELKNNIFVGGGLEYYVYAGSINLSAYYGFPEDRKLFDILLGGGMSFTVGSESKIELYPLLSSRLNFHLNKYNSIGFEIKAPFVGSSNTIFGDIYFMGNVGFSF